MHNNMDAIEIVMAIGRTLSLSPFAGKVSKRWMRTFATGPMALIMAAGAIGLTSLHAETAAASLNPTAGDGRASFRAGALRDRRSTVSGDAGWDAKSNHPRHRMPPDLVDKGGGDFIDRTLQVWQRCSPRELTREDARQIASNVTGFFKILAEWDARAKHEGQAREDTVEGASERRT